MRYVPALILSCLAATPAFADGPFSGHGTGSDWSGVYAGVSLSDIGGSARFDSQAFDLDATSPGFFIGYRHDFGDLVVGAQFDYRNGRLSTERPTISEDPREGPSVPAMETLRFDLDRLMRLGVTVGVDLGPALVYASAGMARIDFSGVPSADSGGTGGFFGLGVDYALNARIRLIAAA